MWDRCSLLCRIGPSRGDLHLKPGCEPSLLVMSKPVLRFACESVLPSSC